MVAFSGADPIAVLIGAKRPSGTLIHKIAVHPDHRRQGHGRHLLTSLSSKLSILGPPRMVAEIPETLTPTCELFEACGYVQEAVLTDYVFDRPVPGERVEGFVIPVTVDDLVANGLLEADPRLCWERSVETLSARKDEIEGLAVASDERYEAFILYLKDGEILSLRSFIEDGGARLKQLLSQLGAQGIDNLPVPEGPPGGSLNGVAGDARFPPGGRASPLCGEGSLQLVKPGANRLLQPLIYRPRSSSLAMMAATRVAAFSLAIVTNCW